MTRPGGDDDVALYLGMSAERFSVVKPTAQDRAAYALLVMAAERCRVVLVVTRIG